MLDIVLWLGGCLCGGSAMVMVAGEVARRRGRRIETLEAENRDLRLERRKLRDEVADLRRRFTDLGRKA